MSKNNLMNIKLKIGLAVIIALLVVGTYYVLQGHDNSVGAAVDCTQNTCFTSLGVTGTSQVDGAFITNGSVTNSGAITNSGANTFTSSVTFGTGGTSITKMIKGTCTLVADAPIAATSTGYVSCSTGGATVTSGDIVFVTLATTTSSIAMNYAIVGANASTTNTTSIEVKLLNLRGVAATPSATAGFGSSTQFLIIR